MSEQPENLILMDLRRIDGKVDRLAEDVADLRPRMITLEIQVASWRRRKQVTTRPSRRGSTGLGSASIAFRTASTGWKHHDAA